MSKQIVVGTCKRCGGPIYTGEVYVAEAGDKVGLWHCYNCTGR